MTQSTGLLGIRHTPARLDFAHRLLVCRINNSLKIMTQQASHSPHGGPISAALIVGDAPVRLWALSSRERLQRQLTRLSIVEGLSLDQLPQTSADGLLVLNAGWVFDEPLVQALRDAPIDTVLMDPETAKPVAAKLRGNRVASTLEALENPSSTRALPDFLQSRTPATLASQYNNKLRKREAPYLMHLSAESLPAVEQRMFAGSYKGVTDFITKYWWPTPARHVTKLCALAGITPNQVTFVSLLAVIAAFCCFWQGAFGLGLAFAWLMTFLDTVDGKLARVTLNSSKFGDIFDHGIDLIHPPFWWWAWIVGLSAIGLPLAQAAPILWIVIGGYVAQRVEEGLFMKLFGIEMHIWRPFDSFFRLITARRNPNLALLTLATLAGRPDIGMVAVAVWTLLCFGVHALQILQAALAQRRAPITSWLSR